MGIELLFEKSTAYLSEFSSVRNITFVQNSSIQVSGRFTVSPGRKASMLEGGGGAHCFPFRMELACERNTVI
jgi:hypothetical protein